MSNTFASTISKYQPYFAPNLGAGTSNGGSPPPPHAPHEPELAGIQQILDARPKPVGLAALDIATAFLDRTLPETGVVIRG